MIFVASFLAASTLAGTVVALVGQTSAAVAIWIAGPCLPVAVIAVRPWAAHFAAPHGDDDTTP